MPISTTCLMNGRRIDIEDALVLRKRRGSPLELACIDCGERVRPHKRGTTGQAAHFEHQERNPKCTYSSK